MKEAAKKLDTSVKAAAPEVKGSGEGAEEQKDSEGEGTEPEKKKKKRIGFHDRKVRNLNSGNPEHHVLMVILKPLASFINFIWNDHESSVYHMTLLNGILSP